MVLHFLTDKKLRHACVTPDAIACYMQETSAM